MYGQQGFFYGGVIGIIVGIIALQYILESTLQSVIKQYPEVSVSIEINIVKRLQIFPDHRHQHLNIFHNLLFSSVVNISILGFLKGIVFCNTCFAYSEFNNPACCNAICSLNFISLYNCLSV